MSGDRQLLSMICTKVAPLNGRNPGVRKEL